MSTGAGMLFLFRVASASADVFPSLLPVVCTTEFLRSPAGMSGQEGHMAASGRQRKQQSEVLVLLTGDNENAWADSYYEVEAQFLRSFKLPSPRFFFCPFFVR